MNKKKLSHYFFLVLLLLLLFTTFLIMKPYISYILFSIVLAYGFYPLYLKTKKVVRHEGFASLLVILFILVIIVLPIGWAAIQLWQDAGSAYESLDFTFLHTVSETVNSRFGTNFDFQEDVQTAASQLINYIIKNVPNVVGELLDLGIGMFVMTVGMYFLFKKGHLVVPAIKDYLPLKEQYKDDLLNEIKKVTHGVVYSQVLISLVQGILVGVSFVIFGVNNPVLWGFIAAIFSFLPVIGPPMIWIPAGVYQFFFGNIGAGIGILVFNAVVTMNIDNVMRPTIVGKSGQMHPLVALVGIIGGIKVFGFIGILLGPLIISLFLVLLKYFNKEF